MFILFPSPLDRRERECSSLSETLACWTHVLLKIFAVWPSVIVVIIDILSCVGFVCLPFMMYYPHSYLRGDWEWEHQTCLPVCVCFWIPCAVVAALPLRPVIVNVMFNHRLIEALLLCFWSTLSRGGGGALAFYALPTYGAHQFVFCFDTISSAVCEAITTEGK